VELKLIGRREEIAPCTSELVDRLLNEGEANNCIKYEHVWELLIIIFLDIKNVPVFVVAGDISHITVSGQKAKASTWVWKIVMFFPTPRGVKLRHVSNT
jgi:hypothetical protein